MSGLRFCTAKGLIRAARCTEIMNRETSGRTLWDVFEEQCLFLMKMEQYRYLFGAKPRKVGWSLTGVHATLHETDEASRRGERMRSVFAIDKDSKALEHLERAADMADQFKMFCKPRRSPPYSLTWRSGAHFDFLTMGQDEPGRGGDIHRLQITELPFAAHPERAYHSLRSACTDNAPVAIETTLTTLDPFTASLWRGARRDPVTREVEKIGSELHRFTSFVQTQKAYRLELVEVV